jgi:putative flippase GtrA
MDKPGHSPSAGGLARQFSRFAGVGLVAALFHYTALIGLVEGWSWTPVKATLIGYLLGGLVSYWLNRRHVFQSDRPHHQAAWRFVFVALAGFGLTFAFMHLFVEIWRLPYLPAQFVTTGLIVLWSFIANRLWTFAESAG